MKASIQTKLDHLKDRYEELAALMSDAEIISNQNLFRDYSKEYAEIELEDVDRGFDEAVEYG